MKGRLFFSLDTGSYRYFKRLSRTKMRLKATFEKHPELRTCWFADGPDPILGKALAIPYLFLFEPPCLAFLPTWRVIGFRLSGYLPWFTDLA